MTFIPYMTHIFGFEGQIGCIAWRFQWPKHWRMIGIGNFYYVGPGSKYQ